MSKDQAPIVTSVAPDAPSVNFHLWEPCNMRCGFCFAQFKDVKPALPRGHLERQDALEVVEGLCGCGFEKINFAGGEPTLCPWLPDLIGLAKSRGLTTSIVTNGSRVTEAWLDGVAGTLDWMALSVDSVDPDTLKRIGRTQRGKEPMSAEAYRRIAESARRRGVRLKVNTVVNRCNHEEDLTAFILSVKPERWKLLQALRVEGQNDGEFEAFAVSDDEFQAYAERSQAVEESGIRVVAESNELMRGSYVMVDPAGRFFDNASGGHRYSRPILEVGVEDALREVDVDAVRFRERGGFYDWRGR